MLLKCRKVSGKCSRLLSAFMELLGERLASVLDKGRRFVSIPPPLKHLTHTMDKRSSAACRLPLVGLSVFGSTPLGYCMWMGPLAAAGYGGNTALGSAFACTSAKRFQIPD